MDIEQTTLGALEKEFGSILEPDNSTIPLSLGIPPLRNRFEPVVELGHEKPEHRLIAVLKAAGHSNVEIAALTGYTPLHISTVCKQTNIEQFILERMHGTGDKAMQILHEASVKAAERLIEIAKTAVNEECKRKANNDILDRRYGKPNQPYTVQTKQANELEDSELAKIAQGN